MFLSWCPTFPAQILLLTSISLSFLFRYVSCQETTPPLVIDPAAPWAQNGSRLATDVIPINYDLILRPDLNSGAFTGNVSILMSLTAARSDIYLNARNLNVSFAELHVLNTNATSTDLTATVVVNSTNSVLVPITRHFVYNVTDAYVIQLGSPAAAGRYVLNLGFNGSMLDKLGGLYRSSYKTPQNVTRYLATTQFETSDARQAFPCFDEPNLKATFNITVVHSAAMTALSNMPAVRERVPYNTDVFRWNGGLVMTQFDKTVPMSTYMVAVVVCDFNFVELYTPDGIRVRVYATPEQISRNSAQFALLVANRSLSVFSLYFDIPYHLPKLDIVAIPDYWDTAMENYGLITVRELYGLFDPRESTEYLRLQVAYHIAHEVAHQWCGDLVTADWWTQIWLNESPAERMQYIGILGIDPNLPVSDFFVTDELQPALAADSLMATRALITAHPSDVDLFDSITYSKGASVLRMIANVMGPEPFRLGFSRFLKAHFLGNANSGDLYNALTDQLIESGCNANSTMMTSTSGSPALASSLMLNEYGAGTQCFNVKQVMDTWTLQPNYPILHIENLNFTHGRIRQERFLIDSSRPSNLSNMLEGTPFTNYSWFVPVTYQAIGAPRKQLVWATPSVSTDFPWPLTNRLFTRSQINMFNPGQNGFYRVNYPSQQWTSLAEQLASNINYLPNARDRSGLIDDAFELAKAGVVPYIVPLSFLRYLQREPTLTVWTTLGRKIDFISARLRAVPETYEMWRQLIRELIKPLVSQLGWNDFGISTQRRLRALLLDIACEHGEPECLRNTRQLFSMWLRGTRIPPNLRALVYKFGMRYADDDNIEQIVRDRLTAATGRDPQETRLLIDGVASGLSRPWQIVGTLRWAEDENNIRRHDYLTLYSGMATNPVALPYAWLDLRSNWPRLVDRFSLFDSHLSELFPTFAGQFNLQQQLDEMRTFFGQHPVAGSGLLHRMQALEITENNLAWLTRNSATFTQILRDSRPTNG